jgi:hypothetical protein
MLRISLLLFVQVAFCALVRCNSLEPGIDPTNKLLRLHDELMQATNDVDTQIAHEALKQSMRNAWTDLDFWSSNWPALSKQMGAVSATSGSQQIAVITWNVEMQNRTQQYGGFVISKNRQDEQSIIELKHSTDRANQSTLEPKKRYKAENWPGAVYYEVIPKKQGKNSTFTLLGWDGADGVRSRKIVETLSLSHGRLRFGIPILNLGKGSEKRLILEFSDSVSAMLRWREDLQMIVMDHLSAPESQLEGNTAFYGPDMTYDGLTWQKNHWVLKKNIEVRDPDMKKPWNNPKRLKRKN